MRDTPFSNADMLDFFQGYVACALWSSTDDEGNPMDENFGEHDIHSETQRAMWEDCVRFLRENAADIVEMMAEADATMEIIGHDFWLTRNYHGTGFWDRGAGDVGERLTDAAHAFGAFDLYVGDDGKVHA